MKNYSGISMIELVVIIVCIVLIIGFAIFSGIDSVKETEAAALYVEMKNLVSSVSLIQTDLNMGIITGLEGFYDSEYPGEVGYYRINAGTDTTSDVIKNLNLSELKRDYVVNFITSDVKLLEPVSIGGVMVESFEDIQALVEFD